MPRSRSLFERLREAAQRCQLRLGDLRQALGLEELSLALSGRPFHRRPDVASLARRRPQQPERVGGEPAGGRGEGTEQRLVVERVGDRRQQRAGVSDLLLGPVAATADHVRPQPNPLKRILVGVEVGEGPQQHDHLSAWHPGVDQLPQPRGKEAGLGEAAGRSVSVGRRHQIDALGVPAVAGGEQQLDRCALAGRGRKLRCGADPQRAVGVAEQCRAECVDGADHLGARAEVAAQLHPLGVGPRRDRSPLLAEDLEIGMAESVDRLQLVADRHQLTPRPAQRLHQAQLQAVGVLELVDHQVAETRTVGGADLTSLQQPRGEDLEVLEVDPRAPLLGGLEAGGEEPQQGRQMAVGDAALAGLGGAGDRRLDRLAVGGERLRPAVGAQRRQLVEARQLIVAALQNGQRSLQALPFRVVRLQLLERLGGGLGGAADRRRRVGRRRLG